ncbi:MAG: class I SAM-dependent methyltransferase [Anaerolineae bacterium]|nr:class I SAM-dependent methyltransferase [Anaerolineae bacterium]
MYDQFADWWPLLSAPKDYAEEVDFFLPLLRKAGADPASSMLELGSGGGNNASHFKHHFAKLTLVDLAPGMLEVSRKLNPECEHHQGDMRSVRLGRQFDVVFIHDAICYMLTLDDLRQALETAYLHLRAGGVAMFVPDDMRDSFKPQDELGGEDGDGRSMRYVQWSYDPDPTDTLYTIDFVFLLREGDQPAQIVHDRHINGLFTHDEWMQQLQAVGFEPECVIDPFERHVFVAKKRNE